MSIEVRELSFGYDPATPVLHSLSFAVQAGEMCALVGPSGSGKSTLLEVIAGFHRPSRGSVRIFGVDPAARGQLPRAQTIVALVLQNPERQFFNETVGDEVAYALRRRNVPAAEVEKRVHEALNAVGCPPSRYLRRSPFHLSGGEQRAVALAVALALSPRALLLDEPTAGLDPATGRRLLDHLDAWRRAHEAPVILVSHDMAHVSRRADRVLALKDGHAAFFGEPGEFFTQVELLERLGLEEPPVPRLLRTLRERGLETPYPLFEVHEAAASLAHLVRTSRESPGRKEENR